MANGSLVSNSQRLLNEQFSTSATSKLRVPSVKKLKKKDVQNTAENELHKQSDVFMTDGFGKKPTIPEPAYKSADFYREGNASGQGGKPNMLPKSLDDFLDASGNEELASIRVLGPPGGKSGVKAERKDLIPPYTKFILESVQEAHSERSQVVETFGDFYVFFFGERPPVYNFSGTLINSKNHNWLSDFMFYYDKYLRGTKCVENNATLLLTYGGRQVEGFMMNTGNVTAAQTEKGVNITFQVLIIDRKVLQHSVDFDVNLNTNQIGQQPEFMSSLTESGLSLDPISAAFNKVKEVLAGGTGASDSVKTVASSAESVSSEFGIQVSKTVRGGLSALGVV